MGFANNALPWWIYELRSQKYLAKLTGCMEEEWVAEWAVLPAYELNIVKQIKQYNEFRKL